ncbi:diaminopimelate epimerase [Flavobacterium sp.]|uniref:diaminopimelate epimerase n=1 Tax=Flavobacterium sp. TaxID=239 RepID=UPI003B999C36
MKIHFYKYQGAGNDFVMIDNRSGSFPTTNHKLVQQLCDRRFGIGADGLIAIEPSENTDFKMLYYNSDGNFGSMCGNGGRCAVAFASKLGIVDKQTTFEATDGLHTAKISDATVSLSMNDVTEIRKLDTGLFLNTGSPHLVLVVDDVETVDVAHLGAHFRNDPIFAPGGTNVNFVQIIDDSTLKMRTFERGVEAETLACGTGATAAALALFYEKKLLSNHVNLHVAGGTLAVHFSFDGRAFTTVELIGPAKEVYSGTIDL